MDRPVLLMLAALSAGNIISGLSDFAVIGFEQTSEPLDTDNFTRIALMFWVDNLVDTLV